MAIGFEVELKNTYLADASSSYFDESLKGVPLFTVASAPPVTGVIETGTVALLGHSMVELVSSVDKNPYAEPAGWRQQIAAILDVAHSLSSAGKSWAKLEDWVKTHNKYANNAHSSQTAPTPQVARASEGAIGSALDIPFLQRTFSCCMDDRIASVRNARLRATAEISATVQVNFSTNLKYLGESIRAQQHPFEAMLREIGNDARCDLEQRAAAAVPETLRRLGLVSEAQASDRLWGFLFLVLQRLLCEDGDNENKSRFLFLPRFDLVEVKRLLSDDERKVVGAWKGELATFLRAARRRAAKPADATRFSYATHVHHDKALAKHGLENTVAEFLLAIFDDAHKAAKRRELSSYLVRVPDSTVPEPVDGVDNLVFEGRLESWEDFVPKLAKPLAKKKEKKKEKKEKKTYSMELVPLDSDSDSDEESESDDRSEGVRLRAALIHLGELAIGFDDEPGAKRKRAERPRQAKKSSDENVILLDETVLL